MTPGRHLPPPHGSAPSGDPNSGEAAPPPGQRPHGYRKATTPGRPNYARRRLLVFGGAFLALLLVLMLGYVGYVWTVVNGIQHSDALGNASDSNGVDLLIMGLDSRLDERGHALPKDIYNALHAGDSNDGGLNSNVLMYVHVPKDGSKATGFSIPRDDYVDLAGCPDNICKGKIKQAYGYAFDQKQRELAKAGIKGDTAYQQARDFARQAEIQTVDNFLGVKINRFVEVTMVAFFEIAKVVEPIKVCLKQDTKDIRYSGANFKAGPQEISAEQAVAFVRQRRDENESLDFTDLDRSRRQQAFIISLLTQLKSSSTLLDPTKITGIVNVAKDNVVISNGLNPLDVAKLAQKLSGGNLHFYTLPVVRFDTINSESVNIVDPVAVRAMVDSIINPPAATHTATPSASPTTSASSAAHAAITVNVVNSAAVNGGGKALLDHLASLGYTPGVVQNGTLSSTTRIRYAPDSQSAAEELARSLGTDIQLVSDPTQKSGHLTIIGGTDVIKGTSPSTSTKAGSPSATASAVDATGGGKAGPAPTQLTDLQGGGIPCVK